MKTNPKMALLSLVLLSSLVPQLSEASGGATGVGGGGDSCESRIQVIRDDIQEWIRLGGPRGFQGVPVSVGEYSERMSYYLSTIQEPSGAIRPTTRLECIHRPVEVQGVEKTCRFDQLPEGPKITCHSEAFLALNADDQYRLVHHEYAGLAGLEVPSESQSSYVYSNQLSAFLENQVVRKLAVKPASDQDPAITNLRAELTAAATPRASDLRIGQRWNCVFRTTEKTDNTLSITFNQSQGQFPPMSGQMSPRES